MIRIRSAILVLFCAWSVGLAQQPAPKFSDYPVRVTRTKSSVKVKVYSTPDTSCFGAMLRQTARQGVRFAGHYAIDYWGCGTNCARIGIVDLNNGRAYVSPFYVGIAGGGQHKSIKTEAGSMLVLVNDPEVVRKEYGDPAPEEFAPAYFLWTGKQLLPIREGKVESVEPKRAFEPCSKKKDQGGLRSVPGAIATGSILAERYPVAIAPGTDSNTGGIPWLTIRIK